MTITSTSTGRLTTGRLDVVSQPASNFRQAAPVVYCHSSSATPSEVTSLSILPAIRPILYDLVARGLVVAAPDLDLTWGTRDDLIDDAATWANTNHGTTDPPILVGSSHGVACALHWAANHTATAVVGLLPCVDLNEVRDMLPDTRAPIDAAWGITWPTPVPAGANPIDEVASITCPVYFVAASDDDVSVNLAAFITAHGDSTLDDVGALGHTNAAIAASDVGQIINFVQAELD